MLKYTQERFLISKIEKNYSKELNRIKKCAIIAKKIGLEVHAGHGIDYKTTKLLSKI